MMPSHGPPREPEGQVPPPDEYQMPTPDNPSFLENSTLAEDDINVTVLSDQNGTANNGYPSDEDYLKDDVPLKTTTSELQTTPSDTEDSPPLAFGDTYASGDSETEDSLVDQVQGKDESSCVARYTVIYVALFVLIAAIVIISLAAATDIFKGNDSALAVAVPSPTGGLPFPSPAEPFPPNVTENTTSFTSESAVSTLLPTDEPTFAPTTAPVTLSPTQKGETYRPTSASPSESPSTAVPTAAPTAVPTAVPTASPLGTQKPKPILSTQPPRTPRPTEATPDPTASPTAEPTKPPTSAPTSQPTVAPTRDPSDVTNTPLFRYLTVLGTPADVLSDPTTPQGKAYRWLIEPDVENISVFRAPQRYALVALDFALHERDVKVVSAWQTFFALRNENSYIPWRNKKDDVCDWEGVTCDNHKEVIGIKWSNQNLKGKIIPEISLLPKLEKVDLAQNFITGNLDPFWELPELTHLYLFENLFSGPIPNDRPAPAKLKQVYLGYNELTGTLPLTLVSSLDNGPKDLRYLILHNNYLTGTLPEGMRLRNLFYLDLSNNEFEGSIPTDWVFYMQQLRFLYLSNNQLSGSLPEDFGMLGNSRMKQFFINNNKFNGEFPSWGWSDYFMTNMNIANNNFEKIDKKVCKLSVFEGGEMIEFVADCELCRCDDLCHTCVGASE